MYGIAYIVTLLNISLVTFFEVHERLCLPRKVHHAFTPRITFYNPARLGRLFLT